MTGWGEKGVKALFLFLFRLALAEVVEDILNLRAAHAEAVEGMAYHFQAAFEEGEDKLGDADTLKQFDIAIAVHPRHDIELGVDFQGIAGG